MNSDTTASQSNGSSIAVAGIAFISAYVADYHVAYEFYSTVLGLENMHHIGESACFFRLGNALGLYLEGGNTHKETALRECRTTFALTVPSTTAMFNRLREAGAQIVQREPMDMTEGNFWFEFYDPSGNLLEVFGGK